MTTTPAPKVILITGASSGSGEATARQLASEGHCVVLGARRTERLVAIVADIRKGGGTADCFALDVTSVDSMREFAAFADDIHGRIDGIIDNAGVMRLSKREALQADQWNQMIDVNIRGVVRVIRDAAGQPAQMEVSEVVVRPTASAF